MNIVQQKVLDVVQIYKTRDPRKIAKNLGLDILEIKLPERFRGFLHNSEDNAVIVVNKSLTERAKRTVIAHEIGHYCLDPEFELCMHLADKVRATKSEKRADLFAATLLVSSWEGQAWQIAERYDVEEELVVSVMQQLEYNDKYNDDLTVLNLKEKKQALHGNDQLGSLM